MKKMLSIVLLISMLTGMFAGVAYAEDVSTQNSSKIRLRDEIIRGYKDALNELNYASNGIGSRSLNQSSNVDATAQIQRETVFALQEAGFEAYDVNSQTFANIEATLQTDLEDAGLNPDGQYIILIEGNDENCGITPAAIGNTFYHSYNGTTYTLRWMTLYVTDDPILDQYTEVNLIDETCTKDVLIHFLDASLDILIGEVNKTVGIVKTILGLEIADFNVSYRAKWDYNATSTWTRRYTQVWDSYHENWFNGCCVEEVEAAAYLNGWYYDAANNTKIPKLEFIESQYQYSDHYDDYTWRTNNAVIGFLGSSTRWDITDGVTYIYDGAVVARHPHNF